MQIATDAHVTLRYAVALESDAKPDCDADGQVTEFIAGRGQILAGLEAKLGGRNEGERLELVLPPAEAFGEHDPALELSVPFSDFPDGAREHLKPGVRFRGPHPSDPARVVGFTVREVSDEAVLASGNHPLAGKTLRVACEVLAVREATEDELSGGGCGSGGCGSGSCGSGSCGSGSCGSHEGHDHEHDHEHGHSHGGGCGSGGCGCH
ncbi:MAG: FKBP-type peptidyl-prolyl cis-trans isomerase [Planctomycetes bacterium]|nr:FKBP-type peptidyl-prolyl cis-trans isomerase [Planctomycetota bacterium]